MKTREGRLERRLARLEKRLGPVVALEKSGKLPPVMSWVAQTVEAMGVDLDENDDGVIEFEEAVDQLIPLQGMAETVTDMGIKVIAMAATMIYTNRATSHGAESSETKEKGQLESCPFLIVGGTGLEPATAAV